MKFIRSHLSHAPRARTFALISTWGGAKRNPRIISGARTSPRSGRQYLVIGDFIRLSHASRARNIFPFVSWGFASLHPRLYASTRSAG